MSKKCKPRLRGQVASLEDGFARGGWFNPHPAGGEPRDEFEAAVEKDRLWFEAHPDEDTLIRVYVPGEFGAIGYVPDATIVTRLKPGYRARQPLVFETVGGIQ